MKQAMQWQTGAGDRARRSGAGRAWLGLVLGGLAFSGCDDPVATERGLEPLEAAAVVDAGAQTRFISNATRYSNTGATPATGRAGSATLSGQVLVDGTGQGELRIEAGSTGGGAPYLGLVQIKVFRPDGRLLYTRNDAPASGTASASYMLGGIGRDARVQVQANVIGADPLARAGVVTVDAPVRLRPDLEVAAIAAPRRVALLTTVGLSATIRELNGDVGARASCALLVDDVEVDRAWGIWVDAGSAVSCAFRHRFEAVGIADVEVRLVDVEPRDFDAANNAAQTTVDVILVPSAFVYDASFQDITFEERWRSEGHWRAADGSFGYEWQDQSERSGREQHAFLWAWTPRALAFPLDDLVLQQMTRDEVVHSARFADVPPDWSWSDDGVTERCISRWFDTPNGYNSFDLCSVQWEDSEPFTYLQYSRYAGDVTYHSRGDARWWDHNAGYEDVWSWNDSWSDSVGRMVSYGREYGFFISIQDPNGLYRMQPLVWLQPFSEAYDSPWSCWEYDDEWGSSRSCHEASWRASGLREWVSGWPTY